ncbi:transposase [Streptomyces sp. NPDC050658]|uniref:transposase n=1 Tax=unclassified Streptomyces TaxID=2593676 RepID=UPI0034179A9E
MGTSESCLVGRNFLSWDRECDLEMPQSVREWLPPEYLCWKVLDAVDQLDLSAFEDSYRGDGQGGAAYPPASLVALLLYCYSKGIRSSRRIEQACWDDVGCRVIAANRRVDHSTVARFVRRHRAALRCSYRCCHCADGVVWSIFPRWPWTVHRWRRTHHATPTSGSSAWTRPFPSVRARSMR